MPTRQIRVFVPSTEPANDWAETLIGRIFRPLTEEFREDLDWFWFSRYACLIGQDSNDCEIDRIPDTHKRPLNNGGEPFHRSMRFRFKLDDPTQFEQRADELINQNGYRVSGFLSYDSVGDTGSNRVLGVENRQPGRAEQRDQLVTEFYCASSKLVIDALTGPDENGRFRMERNDDGQNPRGSTFQSLLHLFCNMTNVPTDVYVFRKGNNATFGTFMYPPDTPIGGWDDLTAFPIRY